MAKVVHVRRVGREEHRAHDRLQLDLDPGLTAAADDGLLLLAGGLIEVW